MLEAWLFPVSACALTVWAGLGVGGPRAETVGTRCVLQGGPSGRNHVVLTGPVGPAELWELVWEHGACVLVSLCPPDPQEEVRGRAESGPLGAGVGHGAGRGGVGPAGRAAQMGPPQELWPTEMQPVITDAVTVRWVVDGSAVGWPCTFLHVTHISWAAGWGGAP